MTPTEILKAAKAKAKIEDPARWCQGDYARDAKDHRVNASSPTACRWCAVGAIRAAGNFSHDYEALEAVSSFLPASAASVIDLNDAGTHADVMAMFDRAIALAEASS